MANHRARAQFDRAKWHIGLLLPLWALQLTLAMAMTGLSAWRLGDSVKHGSAAGTRAVELAWETANLTMCSVSACCTLFEMAKCAAESLTPRAMLCTHLVKLASALAILALDIAVYTSRAEVHYSLVGLGLDAALTATAAALVVYAVVTHRRLSTYDDYARAANFKGYGFHDDDDDDNDQNSYSSRYSSSDKRPSVASFRRLAATSDPGLSDGTEQPASDRGSYSHERDTQFDEYVARRSFQKVGAAPGAGTASSKTRSRGPSGNSDHVLLAVPEESLQCPGGTALQQVRRPHRQAALAFSPRTSRPADSQARLQQK